MAAIGVHLGCTSACVAVYKDGRADVVANDAGDRVTPAVVAYSENEEIVGLAAKQSRIRNISNTVMKVKQILGRRVLSRDPQLQQLPQPFQRCSCSLSEQPHEQTGCVQGAQSLRQHQPQHSWCSLHTTASGLLSQSWFCFWWG
ncbi:PREDICTED: heat shock 70 kDa protein 14-like isoform X2 [Propithecus coquereli]|uniref:Heat shock protein family A (Hsp70) member 14 n=1 Tax=Propithecus coquereli TaxID=379532 RepID=A0A2K6FJY8_PROCO|nr:PREDICTED: heat shock 70 kDa protein 14-like isoform X2 [Propithecus coquereli]